MHQIEKSIILDEESPLFTAKVANENLEVAVDDDLSVYILVCSKSLSAIQSSIDKARLSLTLLDIGYLDSIAAEDYSKSAYIEMLIENSNVVPLIRPLNSVL